MNFPFQLSNLGSYHWGILQRTAMLAWVIDNYYCPKSNIEIHACERRGLAYPKDHRLSLTHQRVVGIKRTGPMLTIYERHRRIRLMHVHASTGQVFRPKNPFTDQFNYQWVYDIRFETDMSFLVRHCKRQTSTSRRKTQMPCLYESFREKHRNDSDSKIGFLALKKIWDENCCEFSEEAFENFLNREIDFIDMPSRPGGCEPWSSANRVARYQPTHYINPFKSYMTYIDEMNRLEAENPNLVYTLADRADPYWFSEDEHRQQFRAKSPHHRTFDLERFRAMSPYSRPFFYPEGFPYTHEYDARRQGKRQKWEPGDRGGTVAALDGHTIP